jgi:hypothetical protein
MTYDIWHLPVPLHLLPAIVQLRAREVSIRYVLAGGIFDEGVVWHVELVASVVVYIIIVY